VPEKTGREKRPIQTLVANLEIDRMSAIRHAPYAPRNALNADALKAGIAERSAQRGDAGEVRTWLLNHFLRHLVANFEPAQRVETLEAARQVLRPAPLPEWVAARFNAPAASPAAAKSQENKADAPVVPLVWVNPDEAPLRTLEARLVEFLNSRQGTPLEGKLNRVNCPQALALWEKEHAEMAAKIERGWRQSQPEALRPFLATPNGAFVEFCPDAAQLRAEMAFESYTMRHCLGQFADRQALTGGYGESYAKAIEAGELRLLSFRDAGGQPHMTISIVVRADGKWQVDQVKGKQNRPPVERYIDDLLACLNQLEINGKTAAGAGGDADRGAEEETPDDCIRVGVARAPEGWRRIGQMRDAAAQTALVARYPSLFRHLSSPAPMVEWLIAARSPELFAQKPPLSAALRYVLQGGENGVGQDGAESGEVFATEDIVWPGFQAEQGTKRAKARKSSGKKKPPLSISRFFWAMTLCWLLALLGVPSAWLLLALIVWFCQSAWRTIRGDYDDTYGGRRLFALLLAQPLVDATAETGFFDCDTSELTPQTHVHFRAAFLHYAELRANASVEEARAHLAETLERTWYRADLHTLLPTDDPRAALAFACVRLAFFARNATLMGWIDSGAVWRVLLLNAQRAQDCFANWEDFSRAYLAGRQQWVGAYRADPLGKRFDETTLRRFLTSKNIWAKQPWARQNAFCPERRR
jgi:hypothetical protein